MKIAVTSDFSPIPVEKLDDKKISFIIEKIKEYFYQDLEGKYIYPTDELNINIKIKV